ncbi:tetraspanin-14-like [Trichoplusia ni]|uniref:Tetraspanin-14-like n=1 Tax=Trichoplusia ni TaxID=7111 RepID=A0A7E5WPI0_TRINI|nr:tetraspanin-14-like [Trichoplusia ni]
MAGDAAVVNVPKMTFMKTESEYNMKSIRFLLLTITTMFIVIAGLMIVLGNSVYCHYHDFTFFYESAKVGRFMTPSILCVFLGLALMLISIFGFFGSLKQSTCMVNMYAAILILVFIFKLVIVILAFTMDTDKILRYVDVPVWNYNDPEIQAEVDFLQGSLGCCGSDSYLDYIGMEYKNNQSTVVVTKQLDNDIVSIVLPATCCVNTAEEFCSRMWSAGCKNALVNAIVQNATVIGVLGVSVMFINLLGIIFALLLARCIRKMKSVKALMLWKIKENMIMERQAEEMHKKEQETVYIEPQVSSTA